MPKDFEDTFVAPEVDKEREEILVKVLGLGLIAIAEPFFDGNESSLASS